MALGRIFLRQVLRLGRSRGVTLPPKLADQVRMQAGTQVQVLLRDGELVIRNVDRRVREAVGG